MNLSKHKIQIFSDNGFLVIEDFPIRQKIKYDYIDSALIFHVGETYNNQIDFYLDAAIVYECMSPSLWNRMAFKIFCMFHHDRYKIEISLKDVYLSETINEMQNNLPNVSFPEDLENSLLWKSKGDAYEFNSIKLIYSKKEDDLSKILRKYNRLR